MRELEKIYRTLFSHYGDLQWWPADSPYEIMIGAILTQNTAWTNVEKAIEKFECDIEPERIHQMSLIELQEIIRPAGFYKQKSQYLKAFTEWFRAYHYDVDLIKNHSLMYLRDELLKIRGIGNETADSILLYAFNYPTFVVDAYTIRLFKRYTLNAGKSYLEIKEYCENNLPKDAELFNHFHALIVINGKEHCKKKPICKGCPLNELCAKNIN